MATHLTNIQQRQHFTIPNAGVRQLLVDHLAGLGITIQVTDLVFDTIGSGSVVADIPTVIAPGIGQRQHFAISPSVTRRVIVDYLTNIGITVVPAAVVFAEDGSGDASVETSDTAVP